MALSCRFLFRGIAAGFFLLPTASVSAGIVINEVAFDEPSSLGAPDWVELYSELL